MEPRSRDLSSNHKKPSDDALVALPSQRELLWQRLRSEFAWMLGTLTLTSLLVIPLMRLWRANLQVPFLYGGDALFNLMAIKGVLEHGWWLENPDLGAPFGQELYDYPSFVGRSFHLLLVKLLGLFISDPALVLNLYFLLSFPLVALTSFVVLRQLGISGGVALVCSVLYAFAPYHFGRNEGHLLLAAYYSVPVGAYLILSLLLGKPLFARRARTRPRMLAWASRRSLVTLALCVFVVSAGGIYYTAFTGMLVVAVMVLVLVTQRDGRALIQGSILLGAIFGLLMLDSLPHLLYELANGPNHAVAERGAGESDFYGLKLARMVLPTPGHRIGTLSQLAESYYKDPIQAQSSEGWSQSLGLVATLGFAWLLLVALAGCLSPRWQIGDLRHRQIAPVTVIACLIGTTGGISSLVAYLISPQIRSWNRISIFIAFFAIAAVGLLLDALRERLRLRRGGPVLAGMLLLSVLMVGLYDQSSNAFVRNYSVMNIKVPNSPAVKDEYRSDEAFVQAIDGELPPQAKVFQLPYIPFPENPPVNDMTDYDLLRPYVHESDLRWSYGAVKGRPAADWQAELADKPTEDLLNTAVAKGFDGIYIDRFGYPDHAAKLESELAELLQVEPLVSQNARMSFFNLLPYKERSLSPNS